MFRFGVLAFCVAVLSTPILATAETYVDYSVTKDEFGSGEIPKLTLGTDDTGLAAVIFGCYSSGLQAQLHVQETIFPDEQVEDAMLVSVTHKVDTADKASTYRWGMNMMEYHDAWLDEDVRELLKQMQDGSRLSMRLDKNGDIFRFRLKETKQHIPKLLNACD